MLMIKDLVFGCYSCDEWELGSDILIEENVNFTIHLQICFLSYGLFSVLALNKDFHNSMLKNGLLYKFLRSS